MVILVKHVLIIKEFKLKIVLVPFSFMMMVLTPLVKPVNTPAKIVPVKLFVLLV